ncbi:trehalose-phosphatase, partial [Phormidium tenue]
LAIHWRGKDTETINFIQSQVRRVWENLESIENLELHDFDGGLELRVTGKDKGTAVESIISNLDSRETPMIAYLGDDNTDEDAFKFLKDKGLSVLVREHLRPTNADLWIKPPEELLQFLGKWKMACLDK